VKDQARFFGDGNEFCRADFAAILVGPASQRLEASDFTRLEIDQRLVKELELVLVEGTSQLRLDREAPPGFGSLFWLVDLGFARLLRLLHRELGVAEQLLCVVAHLHERKADGAFDADLKVGDLERRSHDFLYAGSGC
jgi:hypothetical protein